MLNNGVRITVTAEDGGTHDVTRHVSILYALVVGSLDWGDAFVGAFVTAEDADAITELAEWCGVGEGVGEVRHMIDRLIQERIQDREC